MRSNGRAMWLWWWLGVLVAGCGPNLFQTATPPAPLPPLLSPTLPFATPSPILRLLRTPDPSTVTRVIATPLPVSVNSPTCYETPVGSVWCLGLVRNQLAVSIEQVIIRVYLVKADGTPLVTKEIRTARSVLLPGGMSPYGVLFDAMPAESAGPVAALVSAREATGQPSSLVPLEVRDVRGDPRESGYHVGGTLANPAGTPVRDLLLVVTLLDANEHVTGFRQMAWPPEQTLGPGDSLPFELDVIPQGRGTTRVEASAEGRSG